MGSVGIASSLKTPAVISKNQTVRPPPIQDVPYRFGFGSAKGNILVYQVFEGSAYVYDQSTPSALPYILPCCSLRYVEPRLSRPRSY